MTLLNYITEKGWNILIYSNYFMDVVDQNILKLLSKNVECILTDSFHFWLNGICTTCYTWNRNVK